MSSSPPRPTSRDDSRWAARFGFVDELWRDRARVIFDPELEAMLLQGGSLEGEGAHGVEALLDALVPRDATDGVWMVVSSAEVAAQLRRRRPGTMFVPLDGMLDLLRRADWDVAVVELGSLLHDETTALSPSVEDRRGDARGEPHAVLTELGRGVEHGRAVVASVSVSSTRGDGVLGLEYDEVAEILGRDLGGGRIYGIYDPPMTAVVDFAEPIEAWDDANEDESAAGSDDTRARRASDEGEGDWEHTGSFEIPVRGHADALVEDEDEDEDEDDVPLVYDNTLGSQDPRFSCYLAVAGVELTSEGLTLIELPASAVDRAASTRDTAASLTSLRAQLVQARRRADLAAIDRQSHLERVDALEAENERLRADVAELRDRLARAVDQEAASRELPSTHAPAPPADAGERLDAALAREQALRWRVTQLERELDALIGRPVDAVQAEVASLRARLERGAASVEPSAASPSGAEATNGQPHGRSRDRAIDTVEGPLDARARRAANGHGTAVVLRNAGALGVAPTPTATQAVVRAVEDLVRRVERGGIGALELRRHLVSLRRRLLR